MSSCLHGRWTVIYTLARKKQTVLDLSEWEGDLELSFAGYWIKTGHRSDHIC